MSEYRSDLAAAQHRIELLEAQLAEKLAREKSLDGGSTAKKSKPWPRSRLVALIFAIGTVLVIVAVFSAVIARAVSKPRPSPPPVVIYGPSTSQLPAETVAVAPKRSEHIWYEEALPRGPWLVDLDNDARMDIVGLLWDRAAPEDGLRVAAFDPALRLLWKSPPMKGVREPGRGLAHLVVTKDSAIVTDGTPAVWRYNLTTGALVGSTPLERGAEEACASARNPNEVILPLDARYWRPRFGGDDGSTILPTDRRHQKTLVLDLDAFGQFKPAALFQGCEAPTYCTNDNRNGCKTLDARASTPPSAIGASAYEVWQENDQRITIGRDWDGVDRLGLVGWEAPTRHWRWSTPVATDAHPQRRKRKLHSTPYLAALDHGRFAIAYPSEAGALRLVMFDSTTGDRRFDIEVAHTGIGTRMHALVMRTSRVYLSIDDDLLTFDAATGNFLGSIIAEMH